MIIICKMQKLSKTNYPDTNTSCLVKLNFVGDGTYDIASYAGFSKEKNYHRWLLGNTEICPSLITHWGYLNLQETFLEKLKRRFKQWKHLYT